MTQSVADPPDLYNFSGSVSEIGGSAGSNNKKSTKNVGKILTIIDLYSCFKICSLARNTFLDFSVKKKRAQDDKKCITRQQIIWLDLDPDPCRFCL